MAETLGSLCDKLTIVKLKQFHSEDKRSLENLGVQEENLKNEIDQFISDAFKGVISFENLTFATNKVYKKQGIEIRNIMGTIGDLFSELANVNCLLWHEQEKVYDFEKVPIGEKDNVVKQLAVLNLERNRCIDEIDNNLKRLIENKNK